MLGVSWIPCLKREIKVVFITRMCLIYPRHSEAVHCVNPTPARGEAAGKSQLCNAAEKKSKDRDRKRWERYFSGWT